MNLPSKIIGLLLFIFPFALLHSLESDLSDINEDDKIALTAIESVLMIEHDGLSYFDDMDYQLVIDGHKDRTFDISYNDVAYPATILSKYKQFTISSLEGNKSKAILSINTCDKDIATLHWEDRAVMEVDYLDNRYQLAYGEAGLVREIKTIRSGNQPTTYQLQYTEDEKILSISTEIDGELISKTSYEYTEAAISMSSTNKTQNSSSYLCYIIDDLAVTKIKYEDHDKSKVADMVEYIFNEKAQLVRKVQSQPGEGVTTILGFDYNELGQILKSSRIDASTDTILNHSESLYAYQVESDVDGSICNQKVNKIHSVYDEDGNLASTFKEMSF